MAANPQVGRKRVSAGQKKKGIKVSPQMGIKVSPQMVSTIKFKAKKLAERMGGVDAEKEALDALARLL